MRYSNILFMILCFQIIMTFSVYSSDHSQEENTALIFKLRSASDIEKTETELQKHIYNIIEKNNYSKQTVNIKPFFKNSKKQKMTVKDQIIFNYEKMLLYKIILPKFLSNTIKKMLSENDNILYIEENIKYVYPLVINRSDTRSLSESNISFQYYHNKLDVKTSWQYSKGSKILIAVLDTGIDSMHSVINERLFHNTLEIPDNNIDDDVNGYIDDFAGYDFVDASDGAEGQDTMIQDNDPSDTSGHGTAVSSLIAGGQSASGLSIGISPESQILNIRVAYTDQWGNVTLEADDIIEAVYYAVDMGADIINMSWGGYFDSQAVHDVLSYASQAGCVLVASSGNESTDCPIYPASYSEVISIGAIGINDEIAFFSNYGEYVDFFAPGTDIIAAKMGGGTKTVNGTSYASAVTSGVIAELKSVHPEENKFDLFRLISHHNDENQIQTNLPSIPHMMCNMKNNYILNNFDYDKDGEITIIDVMYFENDMVKKYWNYLSKICNYSN